MSSTFSARTRFFGLVTLSAVLIVAGYLLAAKQPDFGNTFNGGRALEDVSRQMEFGPRKPGSEAHSQEVEWILDSLEIAGWEAEVQNAEMLGHPIQNIVAKRGSGEPWFILGAHYDSRQIADQDPDPAARNLPVPGANDGASGVAVLLELARVLPKNLDGQIWIVFFDAEDNGGIEGWDWILGSRAFVDSLTSFPDGAVIVDMIGDADLQIYREVNSDIELTNSIWEEAAELGYDDIFLNSVKHSMLDDHTPFLSQGIPAIDIIDFDYPYWHTQADTLDKISVQSLQAVGETLLAWLLTQ